MNASARARHFLFAGALLVGAIGSASATLIGTSVTANLLSPLDGVNLTDTVSVGAGIEIQAGDGTNIGGIMFTSNSPGNTNVPEFIDFSATSVILRIAGADNVNAGKTGFAAGARYVFDFQAAANITGINSSIGLSSNISNFSNTAQSAGCTAGVCFDPVADSLTVFLDAITMGPDGNLPAPMGNITINLLTEDNTTPPPGGNAPEPGSLALLGLGLGILALRRRR